MGTEWQRHIILVTKQAYFNTLQLKLHALWVSLLYTLPASSATISGICHVGCPLIGPKYLSALKFITQNCRAVCVYVCPNLEGLSPLGRSRCRWQKIKIILREVGPKGVKSQFNWFRIGPSRVFI
jgi:hypothetical protein